MIKEALRVLQLTDTHVRAASDEELMGVRPFATLEKLVRFIERQEQGCDAIVLTGDLVHDGGAQDYAALARILEPLRVPVHCLPGNHDDPAAMAQVFGNGPVLATGAFSLPHWRIVMLDSTVAGMAHGELSEGELERLDRELSQSADGHALVCVHHHPVPIGSAWMDAMMLRNGDALLAVVARHAHVRALLWGHIHQQHAQRRGSLWLLGAPSTCVQFAPSAARFALSYEPPGYRWLELHRDGQVETGVNWLPAELC